MLWHLLRPPLSSVNRFAHSFNLQLEHWMSCNILQLCQSPIFWSSSSWWVGKCDLDWRTPDWRSLNVLHLLRFAEFILKVCLCIHYTCYWLKDLVEVLEGQQRLMIGTPRGFRTEGMVLPRSIFLCKRLLHVQGSFPCGFFCTTAVPSAVLSANDWRFVFHSQTCCTWAKSSFGR